MTTTIPGLPAEYTARRPTLHDAARLLGVVHAAERDVLGRDDATLAEVRELLSSRRTPPETDHWLVEGDSGVVAWGMVTDDFGGEQIDLDVFADPRHPSAIGEMLLDVLLHRVRELARHRENAEVTAGAGVIVGDEPYAAALRARGFVAERRFNRLRIDFDGDYPFPTAPAGVALEDFDPGSDGDWADWHAILFDSFAEHWGFEEVSLAAWREALSAEEDPEFSRWRFAVVDGERAGICQASGRFASEGGGWIRNLGVVSSARGRGAGRYCSSRRWRPTPPTADAGPAWGSTPATSAGRCACTSRPGCARGCRSTRSGGV